MNPKSLALHGFEGKKIKERMRDVVETVSAKTREF